MQASVANTSATMDPGTKLTQRYGVALSRRPRRIQPTSSDKEPRATSKAAKLAECRFCPSARSMPKKSAGMDSIFRPRKSLICDSMIKTAMPFVKPITTDTGINRIKVPSRNKPSRNSKMPDMAVANIRLARP